MSKMHLKAGMRGMLIGLIALFFLTVLVEAQGRKPVRRKPVKPKSEAPAPAIPADVQAALDRISADSLRGHLSFIASDLLNGRNTPSPGLDVAAEYIAAQFRRAGLEPGGEAGESGERSYFQVANWKLNAPDLTAFDLAVNDGVQTIKINPNQVSFTAAQHLELKAAPLVKIDYQNKEAPSIREAALKPEQVSGKIVLTEIPDFTREDRSRRLEMINTRNAFLNQMKSLGASFIVSIDRVAEAARGLGTGQLIDPERAGGPGSGPPNSPFLTIHDPRVVRFYDALAAGETRGSLSLNVGAPTPQPVKLKNVIGVLPGSDPGLKDTYVIVSGHYDHVAVGGGCTPIGGDRICNGANDDGSGTVSVVEIGAALAKLKQRPKRTIVFITWFGEEKGLLGSRYYGRHPVFPLAKTVAMVNLEQVGRTDSSEGPQLNNASMTGFDFTDLGPIFKAAGEKTGINVYKHEKNSDAFFNRSDNQALADAGVPAHTLCVAFVYPDYHQPGDHWEKIDYQNMARVDRMIALSLLMIANNAESPKWNEANPRTARYVQAWKSLQGK